MRAKRAKKLKYTVLGELYGVEITDKQRKAILNDKAFRNMYRKRKRHYMRTKKMSVA